ncbi:hypothetical protein [Terribacillus sp. JSM ZJ617]|uniref:hypothetical protein n=1 Tax=Terribacillus sp. JSM ZJ617 TaxID=3342119 RepID=UPI0035A95EA1
MTAEEMLLLKKLLHETVEPLQKEVRELRAKVSGQQDKVLTKQDLKDRYQIKDTKAAELLNRKDFPRMPGIGPAKVMLRHLEAWEDRNVEWIRENALEHPKLSVI